MSVHRTTLTLALTITLSVLAFGPAAHGESAQQVFDQLFKKELDRARATPGDSDDLALAGVLLKSVPKAKDSPELAKLLCDHAFELSAYINEGYDTAVAALAAYPAPAEADQAKVLKRLRDYRMRRINSARGDLRKRIGGEILEDMIPEAQTLIDAGKLVEARGILDGVDRVARMIGSDRADEISDLRSRVAHRVKQQRLAENLFFRLNNTPEGVATRERLIRIHALELNNPRKAIELSNKKVPSELVTQVALLASEPGKIKVDDLVGHGDWLRREAGSVSKWARTAMLKRCVASYESFLDRYDADDLKRTRAQLSLDQVNRLLGEKKPGTGKKFDLIALTDVEEDAHEGDWAKRDGKLGVINQKGDSLVRFPVKIDGDYRLDLTYLRQKGNARMVVVLPVGKRTVQLALGRGYGKVSGLELVDDRDSKDSKNPTSIPTNIPNGRSLRLSITVKLSRPNAASIKVDMNGRKMVKWEGSATKLSQPENPWEIDDKGVIGFGAASSILLITEAELTILKGSATPIER